MNIDLDFAKSKYQDFVDLVDLRDRPPPLQEDNYADLLVALDLHSILLFASYFHHAHPLTFVEDGGAHCHSSIIDK